ncbi:GNAT family N-acetyltransferase [Nocardia sp. NBC_01388]|uniref:GNAT family N-acetyltransferase n=1 Tax=Nocardia sp. NBC_01388 TaxID=2903596 RepID=UPI003253136B
MTGPDDIAEVTPVRPGDASGVTRTHLLAVECAFRDQPGAAENLHRFLVTNMAARKLRDWTALAASGDPRFLVARTHNGTVAGFIRSTLADDGVAEINEWYVDPGWHGRGVGAALMRMTLGHLEVSGASEIRVRTTADTIAVERYEHYGFAPYGTPSGTPELLHQYGIAAPQIELRRWLYR